jgi:hypothetical protein
MSVHLESLHTTISSTSISNVLVNIFCNSKFPSTKYCISRWYFTLIFASHALHAWYMKLCAEISTSTKNVGYVHFFPFVLLVIVLVILKLLHWWKEECLSFFWYQIYIEKHFTPERFINILTSSPDTPASPIRPGTPDGPCCPCSPGRPSLPARPFKNQT